MRVRQVMDCMFKACSHKDTVLAASRSMAQERTSFLVVVDDRHRYRGIVWASAVLGCQAEGDTPVGGLATLVPPVLETDSITELKTVDADIVPVVNAEGNAVGVISLRSLVEYLPEALAKGGRPRGHDKHDGQLSSKYTIDDIIGQSGEILSLKERIIAAAKTRSTVFILGETGTGKELVAHAIHRLSDRRHGPFVRMNCATIPENLLESELFGYAPGAFTGAVKTGHAGKFEVADGGTIFLDEIGDMPLALQAKILRVLQEKEIEKIGGRGPQTVDVRVIAATHRDIADLVQTNRFRKDLYYRLHVIPIKVPPLRSHREDIPLLVDHYLGRFSGELGMDKPQVERQFLRKLLAYSWPGNVRELTNILEAAVGLCTGGVVTDEHLPDMAEVAGGREEESSLRAHADEAERDAILYAIKMYRGNKIKVSEALGISRSSLYNKLRKYNIELN